MARRTRQRTRRSRVFRVVLWGLAIGQVAEAVSLRKRRQQIAALPDGDGADAELDVDIAAVPGAAVDGRTRAAVAREMASTGAEVVDLVPHDMPAERALWLLRRVRPDRFGHETYPPGGAHEAVARHPSLVERMAPGPGAAEAPRDRGALVRRTVDAQRHAPGRSALRLAPGLRTAPSASRDRWRELDELTAFARPYTSLAPVLVGGEIAYLAVLTGGLLVAPVPAVAAIATWSAQPAIVFGGGGGDVSDTSGGHALAPPDLLGASVLRLPRAWLDNVRTALSGYRETRAERARRATTPLPDPPSTGELFEPRRETCPWCGSAAISDRLDVTDLLQHKPGTFHLDECADCRHIFQNPALTVRGLDYYYEHAYDGVGEELAEVSFGALMPIYERRIETLARFTEPRAWLDVGTGHGHFPLAARKRWPEATFDGIDIAESVEAAKRYGRVDTAYRGLFPDMADGLPRSYDVLSMHHYLEHTREPRRELAAAAKVLEPGGHLMIEMPDAESPWARHLGRFWWQWAQPQHQHFITCDELVSTLEEGGFEVLSVERGQATMGGELFNAVALAMQAVARSPHLPWLPPATAGQRLARSAAFLASLPAFAVTKIADEVKDARLRQPESTTPGNAYRIVARRT
jgi:ubiquinone/menaquinone biosynthesis C-methylase UbiE